MFDSLNTANHSLHALVALVGQPNCGKTTLFNRLTGSHQKVGNYPGATVEQRIGIWHPDDSDPIRIIDLPGLYELSGMGTEEMIAASRLIGLHEQGETPDLAIVVVDVTAIERSLFLLAEVKKLDIPAVVALNMIDLATQDGVQIDRQKLSELTQMPVVEISARSGIGVSDLTRQVIMGLESKSEPDETTEEQETDETIRFFLRSALKRGHGKWQKLVQGSKYEDLLSEDGHADPWLAIHEEIGDEADRWVDQCVKRSGVSQPRNRSVAIDNVLVHPVWGIVFFLAIMFGVFQSVYTWSEPLIGLVEQFLALTASGLGRILGDSMLREVLVDAGIGGAGNVIVFLPQILVLFFWIAILEETGYLARVSFLLDKPMRAAGMSGRSFIPLLSSFACAVPGIMAARSIENPRTRLVTILVAPLMTCSARLPVYTLIIGAFVPDTPLLGGLLNLPGLVLFGLYAGGVLGGILLGRMIAAGIQRGTPIPMILELPIYRIPHWRNVAHTLLDRSRIFVRKAGTIIFGMSIVLWFLINYPRNAEIEQQLLHNQGDNAVASYRIENSAAGTLGRVLEPLVAPLGFDWKIGISLIASFTAREVMVATLGTIYQVQDTTEDSKSLRQSLRADPVWDLATALAVLVWYIFALQCMSTVAIMKRELGGWKWPIFSLASTYGLAWILAFITYQTVSRL